MALHLTSVLLFQQHIGCIIHVPGKLVPIVINFLESLMSTDDYSVITQFQKLVTLQWKASAKSKPSSREDEEAESSPSVEASESATGTHEDTPPDLPAEDINEQLKILIVKLKGLVIKQRKAVITDN